MGMIYIIYLFFFIMAKTVIKVIIIRIIMKWRNMKDISRYKFRRDLCLQ